ncbi:epimerase [Chromatium okenii]|uniref:NAD-dependent epimerase/dehydratase family protein n=1 Tax=Chromatium okenii TaxID=61644 RepID=UPI001906E343|nr:NAD-dependent epimerase/dehydratase family protein [Chromatium okenii]MBK1642769.1 epimerase [Chromatium okenii]
MRNSRITVLGAQGLIGSQILHYLQQRGVDTFAPAKHDERIFTEPLGQVIYCIGLTADFRQRPLETVEAHVCLLRRLLATAQFESLTYLSSTRVYAQSDDTSENANLVVNPNHPSDLYNLSKLMGESLCLQSGRTGMKIARLSNIIGLCREPHNFIAQLLEEGYQHGTVTLQTALTSEKDYLYLDDAVQVLVALAQAEVTGIFNVASGYNTTNQEILDLIAAETSFKVTTIANAPVWTFAHIDITKIKQLFQFIPRQFAEYFPEYLRLYQTTRPAP